MASFSGLGIGLSFVFGCILLGLVAELFYILWWKKRITKRGVEDHYNSIVTEVSYIFCWKKPTHVSKTSSQSEATRISETNGSNQHDEEQGLGKDLLIKGYGEEGVETELMRLHNLCGPPRFLFTIKEETREDLESDDGKSKGDRSRKGSRNRSLSDLIIAVDTPLLTPLPSPPVKATHPLDCYSHHGFNPLFESTTEAELNRVRSSPPPKFKFLRDAEEKLMRRLIEEAERSPLRNGERVKSGIVKPSPDSITQLETEGSFLGFLSKSKERELHNQLPLYHSAPCRVLPLASSPSTFRPVGNKSGHVEV